MATSDGGVIAQTEYPYSGASPAGLPFYSGPAITFDANGNQTGQIAHLWEYSFRGAYQLGSTESGVPAVDLASSIALTFAAVPGGNLTGNGFSLVHHSFGLFFCNSGLGGDGQCPANVTPMSFSYIPGTVINQDNYTTACDFSTNPVCTNNIAHPDWVNTIKIEALTAFQNAFTSLPTITRMKFVPVKLNNSNNPPFEHTVYVDGSWFALGTGNTGIGNASFSWVFYPNILQAAEINLGSYLNFNDYIPPFADSTSMNKLLTAVGKGIGNSAVHEIGWELSQSCNKYPVRNMGCSSSTCEGNQYVYESEGADAWKFIDWTPAIHWQPANQTNIANDLLSSNSCN